MPVTPEFQQYLKRLILVLAVGALLGWIFGSVAWGLVLSLALLLSTNLWQLRKLNQWLHQGTDREVPEAKGVWGDSYDEIHHMIRRHRESEAHLKSIIDRVQESTAALEDAVVMVDSQGNIEWWNRAAKRLLGLKRPDDVGQGVINLIREPRFVRYFERRLYQEPLELPSPVNSRLHLQYTITEFGRNERLMLIRDVTRLHHLERMRQDFVGNASHELRTPLTVIQGYLETLQDQLQDQNPALRRALQLMESQAKRMANLVTDMLMLSRLETTDSLADELPVNLQHILPDICENARHLQPEKHHRILLDMDPDYLLVGQEPELLSAFSNLIYNAVKYTPENGEIKVSWKVSDKGGTFSVSDNGIGIEPYHISRLTERFYRVDQGRSSAQGGTGLGLAIVKHVLLRHQGKLDIQSQPGKGSTFSCTFPPSMVRTLAQREQA